MIFEIIFLIAFIILINLIIIKNKFFFESLNSSYNPIQKIHSGYVPRIGGLVVILGFYISLFFLDKSSIFFETEIILGALFIIIVGSIEDLYGKATALLRFASIFIASFIFVYVQETLPVINIPILGDILNSYPLINKLFFTFGLTALANGFNLIDGMNGLVGFTTIGCVLSLFTLTYFMLKIEIFNNELIILFIATTVFLFFNFPYGKIFLGDTGAYWVGWIIGIIVIKVYSLTNLNTWGAVIIIFYPLQEVVFSFIRKLIQKKSPLSPDIDHLHLKLYFLLKGSHERGKNFNSLVTVCLMPFWFIPSVLVIWSQIYAHINILFILILELAYLYFYFSLPKPNYQD